MRPPSKSFSGLDQFLFCERQFYFQRLLKLPLPPNMYFAVGNLYHDMLAELSRPIEDLLRKHKMLPGWICPTSDEDLVEELVQNRDRVIRETTALNIMHREVWSRDINPDAEFCAKLDAISTNTPVVDDYGHIIGVEDEACVIDWKTVFGYKRRSVDDAEASAQLALYCLEAKVNSAAFIEIPRDLTRPIRTIVVKFSDKELEQWRKYFRVQFNTMLHRAGCPAEAFRLARFGERFCSKQWCGYWDQCPGGGAK